MLVVGVGRPPAAVDHVGGDFDLRLRQGRARLVVGADRHNRVGQGGVGQPDLVRAGHLAAQAHRRVVGVLHRRRHPAHGHLMVAAESPEVRCVRHAAAPHRWRPP